MSTFDRNQVHARIADVLRLPATRITDSTTLAQLVTDSFVLIELVVELQEDFGATFVQGDLKRLVTVGDVADMVEERMTGGAPAAVR